RQLEMRSVDWCLETSWRIIEGLQDVSTITKNVGDHVGSIPFALQLRRVRLSELSKVAVNSITLLECRRDTILMLHILTMSNPFLSFQAIVWKNLVQNVDPFSQFLSSGRLTSSTIVLKIDWKGEFLTEHQTCRRAMGGCLIDGPIGE